jgi:hypothetical protein
MKRSLLLFLLIPACLHAMSQDATIYFNKLLAIKGDWSMDSRKGTLYESWQQINDSSLKGRSYRLINSIDTLLIEEVELVKRGNEVLYIPVVVGQNNMHPVVFKLTKTSTDTFSFDNPEHDYPQRVIYELPNNGTLHARIEGMDKGNYRKTDFFYKKLNR